MSVEATLIPKRPGVRRISHTHRVVHFGVIVGFARSYTHLVRTAASEKTGRFFVFFPHVSLQQ